MLDEKDRITVKQQYAINLLEENDIVFTGETKWDAMLFINEHFETYTKLKDEERARRRRARRRSYSSSGFSPNYENMNIHEEAMNDCLMIDYCGGGSD